MASATRLTQTVSCKTYWMSLQTRRRDEINEKTEENNRKNRIRGHRTTKLNRRKEAIKTVLWSPSIRAKFAEVLTLDYMSEEDTDPTHAQRKRTVILFAWESPELRVLKRQLDDHETTLSIAKGKGVHQPVDRDQPDWLSDLPKPANAPAWACS